MKFYIKKDFILNRYFFDIYFKKQNKELSKYKCSAIWKRNEYITQRKIYI